jgi:hypothetical protein|eukprot:COSAG06_NODE_13459_length_1255_cov_1.250865_2_plen_63_part_00
MLDAGKADAAMCVVLVPLALVFLNALRNVSKIFAFHSSEEVTAPWTSYGKKDGSTKAKATTW